ncbi:MAG: sensor histidine kinase KdpD [Bryobacteraceae bacterium]|nr:sensor histidine kinase KdpD [Bryobacteraceae bacterium]
MLAAAASEERSRNRGRLKVFFGSAPGVGKTYSMLQAARRCREAGAEVVVGIVETHGRAETSELLEGLEVLPRRTISHRGIQVEEFDLDAALARHPGLMLVDELAHTNAPGSRHSKRWQDVFELVDAGIDVCTTLNVQHLDSLNDVVAQVTGITVRETVPDSVFDQADEIELVDLPVEELRERMQQGKVYFAGQAQRAMENFFRPGNLIALREMALRRTADRVDAQMRTYRSHHAIQPTWPVAERLMVSIGPSPFSAKLIRAAKRLSDRLQAEWITVFVETPAYAEAAADVRERVLSSLRLAEQLGAEVVTLKGNNVTESLLQYARSRNVSKIVLGKQAGPLWRRLWRGSVLDDLIGSSGDIGVIAVSGEAEGPASSIRAFAEPAGSGWHEYPLAAAVIALCTAVSIALRSVLNPVNLVMFFLLGVAGIAMRSSLRVALAASFLSVAAFDFFCVPPYYTFAVSDYEYTVTFLVMLFVAVVISTRTVHIRMQAAHAAEREARTQALYRLTRELAGEPRWFEAARKATAVTRDVFASKIALCFPDDAGQVRFAKRTTDDLPMPRSEEGIAQWVFDHGQKAGHGMETLPGASAMYLPLRGAQRTVGVMAVVPAAGDVLASPEQQHLLELFASQTALAIERAQATAAAREAQLQMETEQMRSGLLSAVSHDLRTPLATITGAASSLLEQGSQMDAETRRGLTESIEQEAERLSRLVNNLLEMTRIESGAMKLKRDWYPIEEIVGAALHRLDKVLKDRPVSAVIPGDLPLISVDDVLIEQLLLNVLENAAKYTPPASTITIEARAAGGGIQMDVADSGPGFVPGEENLVWEKFYRGRQEGVRGAGLGLAICHAIVQAHGGKIEATNRPEGGALIRIWLPLGGTPPEVPVDD